MSEIKKKRKVKTWVWVLGWIICFPIPLTVIISRSTRMNKGVKGILIFFLWFLAFTWGAYVITEQPSVESGEGSSVVFESVSATTEEETIVEEIDYKEKFMEEMGDTGVSFSKTVPMDVTGKWRSCLIYSNQDFIKCASDYYHGYFESDDEIHAVINLYLKTTTKVTVSGVNLMAVVYEYVDGEEHDAKELFSGTHYGTYLINKVTGESEKLETDWDTSVVGADDSIKEAATKLLENRQFEDFTVNIDGKTLVIEFQKIPYGKDNQTNEQIAYLSTVMFTDDFLDQYRNDDEWDLIIVRYLGVGEFRLPKDSIMYSGGSERFFLIREDDLIPE